MQTVETPSCAGASEVAALPEPEIDRVARLDASEFATRYFRQRRPVLITDMATSWPACRRWSFDFFASLDPGRVVSLERDNVLQGETTLESAPLGEYLGRLAAGAADDPHAGADAADPAPAGGAGRPYLSMFRVFEEFPELRTDVDFSLLEAVFIPHGWWHRVLSLTPSISINAFGHDLAGLLRHQSRAWLLDLLHRVGLHGREACTCHQKLARRARSR